MCLGIRQRRVDTRELVSYNVSAAVHLVGDAVANVLGDTIGDLAISRGPLFSFWRYILFMSDRFGEMVSNRIGMLVAAAFLILFVLLLRPFPVRGEVVGKRWERTIRVYVWTTLVVRDWADEVTERPEMAPVQGQGGRAGFQLVPGSCRKERPPYKHAVEQDRCDYVTQQWNFLHQYTASGSGDHDTIMWPPTGSQHGDGFKHVASAVYELDVRAPVVGKCTIVTNEEPYFRVGQYFTYSAWAFGWYCTL